MGLRLKGFTDSRVEGHLPSPTGTVALGHALPQDLI